MATSAVTNPVDFNGAVCRSLEEKGIRYCLMPGGRGESTELELAVSPLDRVRLPQVFIEMKETGYQVVLCVEDRVGSERYHFASASASGVQFITATVLSSCRGRGLRWERTDELLRRRERRGAYWMASAEDEFRYLIARNSLEGNFPASREQRLTNLLVELGSEKADQITAEVYGEKRKKEALQACAAGRLGELQKKWRRELRREVMRRQPGNQLLYSLRNGRRLLRRWREPAGLFLAILGPDGAGKSTTITKLGDALQPIFPERRAFHWRPFLITREPKLTKPVNQPHCEPVRGPLASLPYLITFFLDFTLGYWFLARPELERNRLVIFDRYFHDILIDPLRYRYGGPNWLVRTLCWLVPPRSPLFLVLDASADVIFLRKKDLTLPELQNQRKDYQQFAAEFRNSKLIDSSVSAEQTTADALRGVLNHLAARFATRQASGSTLATVETQAPTESTQSASVRGVYIARSNDF